MPSPTRPKYRPWPKRHDGLRWVLNREKVKHQYLNGPDYAWDAFCRHWEYNPNERYKRDFRFAQLQTEYIKQQVTVIEDDLIPKAFITKKLIAELRLDAPKRWNETAQALDQLTKFLIRRHMKAAKHDSDHEAEIEAGTIKAKYIYSSNDTAGLFKMQRELIEIERAAMLMPASDAYAAAVPLPNIDPEVAEEEKEDQRLKDLQVGLIGGHTIDSATMSNLMHQWLDRQAPLELESPKEEDDGDELVPPVEVPDGG